MSLESQRGNPPTYPFPAPYLYLSLSLSYTLESLISSFVTPSKKGVGNDLVLPNVSSHDSKLCEMSQSSVHNSSKHASFFENKLRETIIKVWNNNFMSSISHRFPEAINLCGTNLLSTSDDCKSDVIRKNLNFSEIRIFFWCR